MKKIVLASGSPRRSELLEQIGVVLRCIRQKGRRLSLPQSLQRQ